jgi:hypothetical protein
MAFKVVQKSKDEFYEVFIKWLESHRFPILNKEILPENVFVCLTDDVPCYCIWFYHTNSKLAWIAFPASNKNVNFKKREQGLTYLINEVCKYAKKKKIKTLITTSGTESVVESLLRNDFELGDNNVSHYIKKI